MALQIELGLAGDPFRLPSGSGSYEWWYFDGVDQQSGLAFVVIFFAGIPFSGRRQSAALDPTLEDRAADHPAVAFSLYDPRGTGAYMVNLYRPADFRLEGDFAGCSIGRNRAVYEAGAYRIALDDALLDGRRLRGELTVVADPLPPPRWDGTSREHFWVLAAPRCDVKGEVRIGDRTVEISATGYHDHNGGSTGLQEQFSRWEWGRAHFSDRTVVYYAAEPLSPGEETREFLEIDGSGDLRRGTLEMTRRRWSRNVYGVRFPRRLELGGGTAPVRVEQRRIVDNGPFYVRFLSRFEREGESVIGFTEVLRPAALSWRWFWPLIDTRVRYHDSGERLGRRITQWLVDRGL